MASQNLLSYQITKMLRSVFPFIPPFLLVHLCIMDAGSFAAETKNTFPPPRAEQPSYEQVSSSVATMKVEDVAWRKVKWRTCLLEGLKASKKQDKPIILWIFIDRPIDDERC